MTTAEATADYPVRLDVGHDASQSRLTNFPLGIGTSIRSLLLIPHFIILYFLQIVANIVYFIACFAILFSGHYPRGLFNFYVGYMRWNANMTGYLVSAYDKYPPFSMDVQPGFPVALEVDYPENLNRILNFPLFIGYFIKLILLIPHLIVLVFLILAAMVVLFIAQFAILFTGSFPEGMHG
ncbi:MAG TPA: DUF4389 domain-containing protein, partial [Dehalococcoidia bacterium]|nr:DUF4389 domain-containing protein [Dehalococcoidia bacterium]